VHLSIIIVNFRTFDLTVDCIKSIKENVTGISYELILVDNAPVEDSEQKFKALFPGISYLVTNENVGFSRANNLGISIAAGKYILLLNSDTLVLDDCIQRCFGFLEAPENAKVGLLGCKNLNADHSFQPSFYPFLKSSIWNFILTDNPILYKIFRLRNKFKEPTTPIEVGDVAGSFMFLRKTVVEKVRAFDPDFFLYFEESEWCKVRISRFFKIFYFPEAKIIHFGGQSTPKNYLFTQFRLSQSLFWYKKGWFSYIGYILYSYINIIYLFGAFLLGKDRAYFKKYIKTYFDLIPYLFYEIPKYSAAYGSRKEMLIFEKAKRYFT
jgi:GT2 family glycosyltransferase